MGVLLDGRPMECLIDTGKAGTEIFHPSIAHYTSDKELESISASATSKKNKYKNIQVKEIRLGSKTVKNVSVKLPLSSKKIFCVLGSTFLFKLDEFGFDFGKKLLTYSKNNLGKEVKKISIRVHRDFGFFLENIQLNSFEKRFYMVFDTGVKTTTFDTTFIQEYASAFSPVEKTSVDKKNYAYNMAKFSINGLMLPPLTVAEKNFSEIRRFIPDFPVAFLGFAHFFRFNWFFDLKNKELTVYTR